MVVSGQSKERKKIINKRKKERKVEEEKAGRSFRNPLTFLLLLFQVILNVLGCISDILGTS